MVAEPPKLLALPLALQCRIFSPLPVDARARCAAVSRGVRALLADPRMWTRLELSVASGVTCRISDESLRAAAARAGGALHTLFVSCGDCAVSREGVLVVLTSNARTLRELRFVLEKTTPFTAAYMTALLSAAPELTSLWSVTTVACDMRQALPLLRNDPPYRPLQLLHLLVFPPTTETAEASVASVVALASALRGHVSLCGMGLIQTRLESKVACDALVDALLARRLVKVHFYECIFAPEFANALARLLRRCRTLCFLALSSRERNVEFNTPLLSHPASCATLADALWKNRTLLMFTIDIDTCSEHMPGSVLLSALVGHPTLQKLDCKCSTAPETRNATGAAVGALIAANSPALTALSFSGFIGTDGLGVLCAALPCNTHLRYLDLKDVQIDEACAAEHLLPAVTANRSLRELTVDGDVGSASVDAAIQLVNERAAADAAAAGA